MSTRSFSGQESGNSITKMLEGTETPGARPRARPPASITRALGQVSKEEWKRNNGTYIKTIDYTYAVGKLATEVRKVFAADGLTVVAQVTWTYIYGGGLLTGATMTRDV